MTEKNTKETLATSASTRENASKYDKKILVINKYFNFFNFLLQTKINITESSTSSVVMEKNTKETSSTLATRKNATLAAKSSASIKEKTTAEIVAVPTREKVTAVAMEAAELIKEKEKTTMTITETAETAEKKHVNGIYHTFNNKKK